MKFFHELANQKSTIKLFKKYVSEVALKIRLSNLQTYSLLFPVEILVSHSLLAVRQYHLTRPDHNIKIIPILIDECFNVRIDKK